MDKGLHLGGAVLANGLRLLPGALPGQDHPLTAVPGDLAGAAGGKKAHLGAGVEGQVRQGLPEQVKKAPVLDQHRVHPQPGGGAGGFQGLGQLPVREEDVQGEEDPRSPDMAPGQGLGELLLREVPGPPAGVEGPPAQIDGVRAVLHGGPQRLRGAGGGQQLRQEGAALQGQGTAHLEPRLSSRCWSRTTSRFSSLTWLWAFPASSR